MTAPDLIQRARPEDIPEDVWATAVAAVGTSSGDTSGERLIVAEAILAERQRSASELDKLRQERDDAFAANERDRSIVAEVRTEFNVALARRSWLLEGRGSYEWDDERWQTEFAEAIKELGHAIDPLQKIGIDWKLCPTNPDEIAAARIDWKARAQSAYITGQERMRERDEARLLAEHYRLAMIEAERIIRGTPMPAAEMAIAINPISQAASNAASVLWQARQDAIFGKFSAAAKAMTAISELQPEQMGG